MEQAQENVARLRAVGLIVVPVTGERAEQCAKIKVQFKIPYVDALAIELAMTTLQCTVITADFDVKPAEHLVSIEFLPSKRAVQPLP